MGTVKGNQKKTAFDRDSLGITGEEGCKGVEGRGIRICPPAALLWSSEVRSYNPSHSLTDMVVH